MTKLFIASLLVSGQALAQSPIVTNSSHDVSGIVKENGMIKYVIRATDVTHRADESGDEKGLRQTKRSNSYGRGEMVWAVSDATIAYTKISTPEEEQLAHKLNDCFQKNFTTAKFKMFADMTSCGGDLGSAVLLYPFTMDKQPTDEILNRIHRAGGIDATGDVYTLDFMVVHDSQAREMRSKILKANAEGAAAMHVVLSNTVIKASAERTDKIAADWDNAVNAAVSDFNKLRGSHYRVIVSVTAERAKVIGILDAAEDSPELMLGFGMNGPAGDLLESIFGQKKLSRMGSERLF